MNRIEPDPVVLDNSLSLLDCASTAEQRLALLRQLVEFWDGPIRPSDGYTEQELAEKHLPMPLRRWFQLAGRREGVMSGQNFLITPDKLERDHEGRLVFYVENQSVYLWSTTSNGDDPHVQGRFNDFRSTWTNEGMVLFEFLIGAFLFQAIFRAPFGAAIGWAEKPTLDRLEEEIPPLPLVPWRWPFFARRGAFMFAAPNDDHLDNKAFSVWIGAKTNGPLAFLKQIVDEQWEYSSL